MSVALAARTAVVDAFAMILGAEKEKKTKQRICCWYSVGILLGVVALQFFFSKFISCIVWIQWVRALSTVAHMPNADVCSVWNERMNVRSIEKQSTGECNACWVCHSETYRRTNARGREGERNEGKEKNGRKQLAQSLGVTHHITLKHLVQCTTHSHSHTLTRTSAVIVSNLRLD